MAINIEKMKQTLQERKEELLKLEEISEESRQPVALDQQSVGRLSRMDAMQQQAMAQATARQRSIDLQRIDAALQRIADGDYGYCLDCDELIAEKRLEIDPMASHCINCAGR